MVIALGVLAYLIIAMAVGKTSYIAVGKRSQKKNEIVRAYNAKQRYSYDRVPLTKNEDVVGAAVLFGALWPVMLWPLLFVYIWHTPTWDEMIPVDEKTEMQRQIDEEKELNKERKKAVDLLKEQNDALAKRIEILQDKDLDVLTS